MNVLPSKKHQTLRKKNGGNFHHIPIIAMCLGGGDVKKSLLFLQGGRRILLNGNNPMIHCTLSIPWQIHGILKVFTYTNFTIKNQNIHEDMDGMVP